MRHSDVPLLAIVSGGGVLPLVWSTSLHPCAPHHGPPLRFNSEFRLAFTLNTGQLPSGGAQLTSDQWTPMLSPSASAGCGLLLAAAMGVLLYLSTQSTPPPRAAASPNQKAVKTQHEPKPMTVRILYGTQTGASKSAFPATTAIAVEWVCDATAVH
ncbi:unnamed protein product [Phytophthora fragariaefolia]|uniref:Unnamed protein product n=1 Tax=Phytophthora fragariaefolia TaxID=1490495 RepID=A0A9W6TQ78_9STRA|nr:unnamed protein product [Phytophthora fragariaefolia]